MILAVFQSRSGRHRSSILLASAGLLVQLFEQVEKVGRHRLVDDDSVFRFQHFSERADGPPWKRLCSRYGIGDRELTYCVVHVG